MQQRHEIPLLPEVLDLLRHIMLSRARVELSDSAAHNQIQWPLPRDLRKTCQELSPTNKVPSLKYHRPRLAAQPQVVQ